MFGYFGAKHKNAKRYQQPKHDVIVEPFAGAAGCSCYWLERDPSLTALLIEKDPRVVDAWRRILAATPEAIAAWEFPKEGERTTDQILSGMAGARSAITDDCVVTPRIVRDFPAMRRRIAWLRGSIGDRIEMVEGDYRDAPNIEACWFVDPPYQHQGHQYRNGSACVDYQQLGVWSMSRKGQTIVCEAEPADWLPWTSRYSLKAMGNNVTTELVWESDPDPTLFDQ